MTAKPAAAVPHDPVLAAIEAAEHAPPVEISDEEAAEVEQRIARAEARGVHVGSSTGQVLGRLKRQHGQ